MAREMCIRYNQMLMIGKIYTDIFGLKYTYTTGIPICSDCRYHKTDIMDHPCSSCCGVTEAKKESEYRMSYFVQTEGEDRR